MHRPSATTTTRDEDQRSTGPHHRVIVGADDAHSRQRRHMEPIISKQC